MAATIATKLLTFFALHVDMSDRTCIISCIFLCSTEPSLTWPIPPRQPSYWCEHSKVIYRLIALMLEHCGVPDACMFLAHVQSGTSLNDNH